MPISESEYYELLGLTKPFKKNEIYKILNDVNQGEVDPLLDYHFPYHKKKYYPNSSYMKNFILRIVPTEYELNNNIKLAAAK